MHARLLSASTAALATGALVAAALAGTAGAAPGKGHAYGHGKSHCRAFHATGTGQDHGDGTTNAVLYQGEREVGTSAGSQLALGDPVDGVPTFTGVILLTTPKGTLEAAVEGTFDTVSGEFSARSADLEGKGPLKNASGWLRISGVQDLVTGEFTEVVHAKICVPKKKEH